MKLRPAGKSGLALYSGRPSNRAYARLMPDFSPVNNLEVKLRALLRDKNTPYWSFHTPLAAAHNQRRTLVW